MEIINIDLEEFQAIDKGEGSTKTKEIIDNIEAGAEYIVVSGDGDYKVILYKDADGKQILGLNKL